MTLDVCNTVLEVAEPLGEVYLKEITKKVLEISSEMRWKAYLYRKN